MWTFGSAHVYACPLPLNPGSGFGSTTVCVFLSMSDCSKHMKEAVRIMTELHHLLPLPMCQWQILFASASPLKFHLTAEKCCFTWRWFKFTILNMPASVLLHQSLHLYLVLDFLLEHILQVSLKIFPSWTKKKKKKTWLFCTHVAASIIEFCRLVLAASNKRHRLTQG